MKLKRANPAIFIVIGIAFIAVMILNIIILFIANLPADNAKKMTKPDAVSSAPDWVIKYPQLAFLRSQQDVTVVHGSNPGTVFALTAEYNSWLAGGYGIWMVNEDSHIRSKLESGETGDCSNISISREGAFLRSVFMSSPCEAYQNYRVTYYDFATGEPAYAAEYSSSAGNGVGTVFANGKKYSFTVAANFDGDCGNEAYRKFVESKMSAFPKITFTGVTVTTPDGKKNTYLAPKKVPTKCQGGAYDSDIADQGIDSVVPNDGKLIFTTSFGPIITIDPSKPDAPPVFKNLE